MTDEHIYILWCSNSTPRYIPNINVYICPQKTQICIVTEVLFVKPGNNPDRINQ